MFIILRARVFVFDILFARSLLSRLIHQHKYEPGNCCAIISSLFKPTHETSTSMFIFFLSRLSIQHTSSPENFYTVPIGGESAYFYPIRCYLKTQYFDVFHVSRTRRIFYYLSHSFFLGDFVLTHKDFITCSAILL